MRPCRKQDANGYSHRYTYDGEGRLIEDEIDDGSGNVAGDEKYSYPSKTQWTRVSRLLSLTHSWTYQIGAEGRLSSAHVESSQGTTFDHTYRYDNAGKLVAESLVMSGHGGGTSDVTYRYDEAGRLIERVAPSEKGSEFRYTYDESGRPVSIEIHGTVWTFSFDDQNRLTGLGEEGSSARTVYSYDGKGRLLSEDTNPSDQVRYEYDCTKQ
jgi:YD repeat-containing protein